MDTDPIQIILLAAAAAGVFFFIISIRLFHTQAPKEQYNVENAMEALNTSLEEVDNAIDEMDKTAKAILEEIDQKHQELLTLYTMIYERIESPLITNSMNEADPSGSQQKPTRWQEIMRLQGEGMSTAEIAQTLNMGKGEIQLIIELGRSRNV